MRTFIIAIAALALVTPLTVATTAETASVVAILEEPLGASAPEAVNYAHRDCVGPGLPGTPSPHATHTTRVSGFVIAPSRPITISVFSLTLFGSGICPTALPGPVLPEDYTGQIRLTGVCRGTSNEGGLFFDFTIAFLSGIPVSGASTPGTCIGALNSAFEVDLTVSLSPIALFGVPLGPLGGIRHTMTQA